ncbi:Fis family transcriptional regulator [Planococcus antarcticus DSM 14505]|uniref:cysteine-S-conjugate beta-lyase n=1 Tax=Planococcus antarcticus DSM 14505 TaxID=1185653 RepID=A0ABM6D337_9BACL|nr:MalY/PatB family protein [Planococcus antarcticus]ANU09627.1 Fis family transcriptional regulator [Planococcus antarcticus DSM 14505]
MNSFQHIYDRKNTRSVKWDSMKTIYNLEDSSDILPMWIADMDFPAPPPVLKALHDRVEHSIFGYSFMCEDCRTAVINWQAKRNDWQIERDWLLFHQGIIPAIASIIETFTEKNDKIVVTPPVYPSFFQLAEHQDREVLYSPLIVQDGQYTIDFEDFEEKLQNAALFILCNPHNPGGRVWTPEELTEIIRLCSKHDVLIISDEIHGDLMMGESRHTPLAKIAGTESDRVFTCMAPTKTFNLAGIQVAMIVATDKEKRAKLEKHALAHGSGMLNAFAPAALTAAYNDSELWLEEMLTIISDNIDFAIRELQKKVPGLRVMEPQSTYLLWIDYSELGLTEDEVMEQLLFTGKVALEPGSKYGSAGLGYLRLNAACPRATLSEGIDRIAFALTNNDDT